MTHPASRCSSGADQATTSVPPLGGRWCDITFGSRPGIVGTKALAASMIAGRLRRLVVISNVSTSG